MRRLGEKLRADQARLREMLAKVSQGARRQLDGSLLGSFTVFARELRDHQRFEEEVLFPELERSFPEHREATESLRREHGPMRQLLADIERGLAHPERAGVVANLTELERSIDLHYGKAERELYPLVAQLQGFPALH